MVRVKDALLSGSDIVYDQLTVHRDEANTDEKPPRGSLLGQPLRLADPLMHIIHFGKPLLTSATTVRCELITAIGDFVVIRDLASVEDFDAWQLLAPAYRACAQSNFSYLLGSNALILGLQGASEHFKRVAPTTEPVRWAKARFKLWHTRQLVNRN